MHCGTVHTHQFHQNCIELFSADTTIFGVINDRKLLQHNLPSTPTHIDLLIQAVLLFRLSVRIGTLPLPASNKSSARRWKSEREKLTTLCSRISQCLYRLIWMLVCLCSSFESHVAVCMAKPTRHLRVCNFNKHTNELSSSCITFVNSRKCIIHLHTYGRYVRVCSGILDFGIRLARKNHFLIILHATTRTPIARVAKPDAAREREKLPPKKNENEYRKRTRQ